MKVERRQSMRGRPLAFVEAVPFQCVHRSAQAAVHPVPPGSDIGQCTDARWVLSPGCIRCIGCSASRSSGCRLATRGCRVRLMLGMLGSPMCWGAREYHTRAGRTKYELLSVPVLEEYWCENTGGGGGGGSAQFNAASILNGTSVAASGRADSGVCREYLISLSSLSDGDASPSPSAEKFCFNELD